MLRRKADEDLSSNRTAKKPRTRVSYSCGECHRRKQKCDRQIPCSHCVARKVPELCKAYTPGKTDQDIHLRLSRLERIIESALPQYWTSSTLNNLSDSHSHRNGSPSAEDDNGDDEDTTGGFFETGKWYGSTASGVISAPVVLQKLQHVVDANHDVKPSPQLLNGDQLQNTVDSKRDLTVIEPSPADKLKHLVQDCGVPPHKLPELLQELPPRNLSDKLIDYYFSAINWTRYPISERDFRAAYATTQADVTVLDANDIRFLPLFFVVLAIAVRMAPDHIIGDNHTRRLTSSRYYWASRRSLLIAAAIQPDCLEMVQTRLLSARFLILDRKITECWSQLGAAVRTAQALGLHRDNPAPRISPAQAEYRRRIWSYLYHSDRAYALVLGRPCAINDEYTSARPPSNVEFDESGQLGNPLPLTTPTKMTYIVLRHALAAIMGRIVHHFQRVNTHSHYSDVLALDDELLRFVQSLPPHYSMDPDRSLDQTFPYIPAHRFLLVTEVLYVRCTLHRPYLLRRLDTDRYLRSRNACFECALTDFRIRRESALTGAKDVRDPTASAYREFGMAMIAGIYLVLYPTGKDVEDMKEIVDTFVNERLTLPEVDEVTRREVKVIEFLRNKFFQVSSEHKNNASGPNIPSERPHPDAQLLLGLHKGSPRTSVNTPQSNGSPMTHGPPSSIAPHSNSTDFPQPLHSLSPVQQLQAESNTLSSSGSPMAEDETSAQSLLDQWCNVLSGGPAMDGIPSAGLPWATPGISDMSGWFNAGLSPMVGDGLNPVGDGAESQDWSYWENLVNQIRSGPVALSTSVQDTSTKKPRLPTASNTSNAIDTSSCAPHTSTGKSDIVKIMSWNVETPVPFLDLPLTSVGRSTVQTTRNPHHLHNLLSRHGFPDFLCLQEVRARRTDHDWIASLTRVVNGPDGPKYKAYTSLNRSTRGQRHFGVVTFVKDPSMISVAREVDWDVEGRIVILEMKSGWALVNVYALNGSEYPWRDPQGKSLPKTRNERKREFNRLLLIECQRMQARGLRLVLIGDFNISLTTRDCYPRLRTEEPHAKARKEFNEVFIPRAKVSDIFRMIHGEKRSFSWFAKGKPQGQDGARVDYALVETTLRDHVVDSQYLENPEERAHSDHAPLLLTLRNMGGPLATRGTTEVHVKEDPTS
ncbi:hypothetical protein K474DRAFT_1587184 [Panus rudis PR-1116 ss-1]|nr:hypothetical protein K474DRAFT_1587184 [Panus rudis PR-1116 ss-1]